MKNTKHYGTIIFICWLAYLISYLGRNNFSACVLEIVQSTGISRSLVGIVSSSFAICNAIGQLISTAITNKISPIKIISFEIFIVFVVNILFPNTSNVFIMALLWGINGFMQATLLCSITRIFTENLEQPWLSRGAVSLNTIGAVGGLVNYLIAPFLIMFFDWKMVFFFVAGLLIIIGIIWCILMPRLSIRAKKPCVSVHAEKTDKSNNTSSFKLLRSNYVLCAIFVLFIIGSFRESIALWIPSYLNDVYKLSVEKSIILTAVVPFLQIFGAIIAGKTSNKINNLFLPVTLLFLITTICFLLIVFLGNFNFIFTITLFVINAISMTAALTFLLSLYPLKCMSGKNITILVGIMNFFVHLGDFFASMSIGTLSTIVGWNFTFLIMVIISVCAIIITLLGAKAENKRIKQICLK